MSNKKTIGDMKKLYLTIHVLAMMFAALSLSACDNEEISSNVNKALWVLGLFIVVGCIGSYLHKREKLKEFEDQQQAELYAINKQKEIERRKEFQERREILKQEHDKYLKSLSDKYGTCDKSIVFGKDKNEILVFSESKLVVIDKKEFAFSDIIDCTVNDKVEEYDVAETYRSPSVATTSTNSGNMLKRAAIGGVLLGDVGAIIGGSTAKRDTTIEYGKDTTIHNRKIMHDYTVVLTVNDIINPNLLINVGFNTKLKDEIVSLFKVIISRNG